MVVLAASFRGGGGRGRGECGDRHSAPARLARPAMSVGVVGGACLRHHVLVGRARRLRQPRGVDLRAVLAAGRRPEPCGCHRVGAKPPAWSLPGRRRRSGDLRHRCCRALIGRCAQPSSAPPRSHRPRSCHRRRSGRRCCLLAGSVSEDAFPPDVEFALTRAQSRHDSRNPRRSAGAPGLVLHAGPRATVLGAHQPRLSIVLVRR
jgi:hypothetical protein